MPSRNPAAPGVTQVQERGWKADSFAKRFARF